MTQTPATTKSDATPAPPAEDPQISYTEWVAKKIIDSKWYVGDGGFIAQAMMADTLEEATATGGMLSGRDQAGIVYRWLSATFADSDLDGILPVFAVCDVVDVKSGEVLKMSVGGSRVVATLFRACEMEWFPFEALLVSIDMGDGKKALNLELAPTRVTNTAKK